jgi:tetratricopeptide (TPR) repeat protein
MSNSILNSNPILKFRTGGKAIIILLTILFEGGINCIWAQENTWTKRANFGGTARYGATGFSIGTKGYIGTGYYGNFKKDFWEYDPATKAWTQKADFGGERRHYAVGFSIGGKGYIGTGSNALYGGSLKKDFWEYDPATNIWTQKADFGGTARHAAVGFSIGSKGYLGTGWDNASKKDFWEYDPASNVWTEETDFEGTARNSAVGFSIDSKGYIGMGYDLGTGNIIHSKGDFWEYDPATSRWTRKADFKGSARNTSIGFSIGSKGYVGLGSSDELGFNNDFWEYNPATNTWTKKADFGGKSRIAAAAFSIGSRGFVGTGIALPITTYLNDFWEYQSDYAEALKSYMTDLKIQNEKGNKAGLAHTYRSIGDIYYAQGKNPEALKNYLTSLQIEEETGNKQGIAYSYTNIGTVYEVQRNYPLALKNHLASLKTWEEIEDIRGMAVSSITIGNIYTQQEKYQEARDYLNKALSLANETGSIDNIREIYNSLITVDSLQGNFHQQLEHFKQFVDIRDSLLNEQYLKEIVRTQMQFEFEKKEAASKVEQDQKDAAAGARAKRQTLIRNSILAVAGIAGIFSILLVRSFNRRRRTSFEKQVAEVEMKALRSQMNPHFIFNSLHSINSYIMDNDKKIASDYLGKFSKLMRMILENSREQEVTLEEDLLALELYLELEAMRFENKFTYKIAVADSIDKENTLIPPLILQPFVENAIFHGLQHKDGHGKILIHVGKEDNMVICTVEDNGVGRQKAMEMKETTAAHKDESLGMKITSDRIDIINKIKKTKAIISVTDLSEGMRVEVKLPLVSAF